MKLQLTHCAPARPSLFAMTNSLVGRLFKARVFSAGVFGIGVLSAVLGGTDISFALSLSREGVSVNCDAQNCEIEIANGVAQQVLVLDGPPRLVADFKTTLKPKSKNIPVPNDALINQMRFGVSAGTLRVVLDLKRSAAATSSFTGNTATFVFGTPASSTTPALSATVAPERTIITAPSSPSSIVSSAVITKQMLSSSSSVSSAPVVATTAPTTAPQGLSMKSSSMSSVAPAAIKETLKPTSTATPVPPTATPTRTPTATASPTVTPSATPTKAPTKAAATVAPSRSSGSSVVSSSALSSPALSSSAQSSSSPTSASAMLGGAPGNRIEKVVFEAPGSDSTVSAGGEVRILLAGRPEAKVTKLDERTFEVVIPGYQLAGRYLSLPYFPPENFTGVTHVKLTQRTGNVQVIVGVSRGVRIIPVTKNGELVLKTAD